MKLAVRCPRRLAEYLELPPEAIGCEQAASEFPLFVPLPYLERMQPGNPADPLLRQVLPSREECQFEPGFSHDPVGESQFQPARGLLQKYQGRVLLVATGSCAIHCRYCFRRHFPYGHGDRTRSAWDEAINHIERDLSITEVILSGGDPLTLVDAGLEQLIRRIENISHVVRLRIHTRLPIVIPQRMTEDLVNTLARSRLMVVVVVHCNHANEIDDAVGRAIGLLTGNSITVLNQAVLLQGVNDEIESLVALSGRLFDLRVLPYYLHQLDPVAGAAHFQVPIERGLQLVQQMRMRLPGYLVPRYVQEIAGQPNKTILA
jgi:EF-P beta-lysylation protein EpmB